MSQIVECVPLLRGQLDDQQSREDARMDACAATVH